MPGALVTVPADLPVAAPAGLVETTSNNSKQHTTTPTFSRNRCCCCCWGLLCTACGNGWPQLTQEPHYRDVRTPAAEAVSVGRDIMPGKTLKPRGNQLVAIVTESRERLALHHACPTQLSAVIMPAEKRIGRGRVDHWLGRAWGPWVAFAARPLPLVT